VKLSDAGKLASTLVDPAWKPWLDLIELAVAESQQPGWSGSVFVNQQRSPDAPLLHGATVRVDVGRASAFVRQVTQHLGLVTSVDPLAISLAGIERDTDTLNVLADRLAVSPDNVSVLAQLSALPLLLNASRALSADDSRTWQRGYCPVCGAWPSLVEMRGIQRERRLRCGCCGSDWLLPVLRCAFCDELDHHKLGSLLSEGDEQHVRVETCATCKGYLKSVTTLSALRFASLAARDASTVAFDLAAQERGFARPAKPGWQLQVEIVQ
jgi:FdhE protein